MKLIPVLFNSFVILQAFLIFPSNAQNIKSYSLPYNSEIDNLNIQVKTSSGKCTIRPSLSSNFVNVYSKSAEVELSSHFNSYVKSGEQFINLQLNEEENLSLSKTISQKVFYSSSIENDPVWNVYLTPYKKMALNLNYNLGTADIDLSGLAVSGLKINTGSADVKVGFLSKMNQLEMDTFSVRIDLGSLLIEKSNYSRAKMMNAEVGFGTLFLDFSDPAYSESTININVGAGSLEVLLPQKQTPIILILNDSPLCHIKLDKSFRKINPNVYVNEAYDPDAPNLTTFNVGVALGNISFIKK